MGEAKYVDATLVEIIRTAGEMLRHPQLRKLDMDTFAPVNLRVMAQELADLRDYLDSEGTAS